VRGAHFASDSLWSGWLCTALAVLALRWAPGAGQPAAPRPADAPGVQPALSRSG
jgi:hypothetical protein